MQKSDIIEIINGKKNLDNKELEKVKIFIDKYPYFETLYNIYIRNSFKISQDSFEDALKEYSVFVNNKRKMVDDIFAKNINTIKKSQSYKNEHREKITQDKEKKVPETNFKTERKTKKSRDKKSKMDEDIFDPVLYERQKVAHKLIVDDFVVLKAEKYGTLRKLLKTENISEEDFWQKLQDEAADLKERSNMITVKKEKNITENKVVEKTEQKTNEINNVNDGVKTNIDETKKGPDNINSNEDILDDQKKVDENEDIFSKIAKLKTKKLQDFNTKQKVERKIEVSEEKETSPEIVEEKIEVSEEKETSPEIVEEKIEVSEEKETSPEIVEQKIEVSEEKETSPEIVEEKTIEIIEDDSNMSAADKILLKLKSKKTKSFADTVDKESTKPNVSADDILKKLRGEVNTIEDTKKEEVEQEKEPLTIVEDTKKEEVEQEEELTIVEDTKKEEVEQEKEPLTIVEDTKKEEVEQEKEPLTIVEDTKKEEDKPITKKQTAADLILEKIRKRKEELPKENLIDKFLTEQPYIDRKREPENTEDLSANSVKETEVATERLAEIYALQGLKEKAISTYEKLILKYPEKNTYFASKIQELKNK